MLLDPHKRITIADSTTVQVLRMSRGRGPQPCIYMYEYNTDVKDREVHVRVRWIMEAPKYPNLH